MHVLLGSGLLSFFRLQKVTLLCATCNFLFCVMMIGIQFITKFSLFNILIIGHNFIPVAIHSL